VDTPPLPPKTRRPTVGLDAPCQKCGRPIYYNYKGPVEGLCGRCTDGSRDKPPRFARSRRIGFFQGRGRRRRIAGTAVVAVAAFAALAYAIVSFL
jgi:hypothetical protein